MIFVEKKKMGRPFTAEARKSIVKRARMTPEDVEKLTFCCEKLGKTESEVLRLGVEKVYDELTK